LFLPLNVSSVLGALKPKLEHIMFPRMSVYLNGDVASKVKTQASDCPVGWRFIMGTFAPIVFLPQTALRNYLH
jgi:hypothetical protein